MLLVEGPYLRRSHPGALPRCACPKGLNRGPVCLTPSLHPALLFSPRFLQSNPLTFQDGRELDASAGEKAFVQGGAASPGPLPFLRFNEEKTDGRGLSQEVVSTTTARQPSMGLLEKLILIKNISPPLLSPFALISQSGVIMSRSGRLNLRKMYNSATGEEFI